MRKRNKTICLGLAALSAVSLSSCNDVSENKEGKVITYTYNDGESSISTEDIMKKYLNENRNDHAKAFYDALYEVVVRANFEKGGLLASYKSKVEDKTSNYIESEKDTAEKNGTSWDDYLINLGYDEENLSTADREHLLYVNNIYTQMKEIVDDMIRYIRHVRESLSYSNENISEERMKQQIETINKLIKITLFISALGYAFKLL